jgi:hypothetical protein
MLPVFKVREETRDYWGFSMEWAVILISSFAAVLQTLQTWHELRGGSSTAVQVRQLTKAEIVQAAAVLKGVLSEETLKKMAERVKACETRFNEVINGTDYLPSEKDQAAVAVGACMCRELWRIKHANGTLPEGYCQEVWYALDCQNREPQIHA